jgi:hypothetical protein
MAKRAFGSSGGVQEPTVVYLVMIPSRRHRRHVTSGTILYVRIVFFEIRKTQFPIQTKPHRLELPALCPFRKYRRMSWTDATCNIFTLI